MNLLLLTEAAGVQERLRRELVNRNHRLATVMDLASALEKLNAGPYDAVIVDCALRNASAGSAIESMRKRARGDRLFVLAMIEREQTADMQAVFRSGADDFVIKPCMLDELVARLERPRASRRTGEFQLPAPEPKARPAESGAELQLLAALPTIVAAEFQALSGVAVQSKVWRPPARPAFACRVSLSLAPQPVSLSLAMAVEAGSLRWLGEQLLDEHDGRRSSLENLACEMVNTFGGAFKRSALRAGVRFQVGLPVVMPLHAFVPGPRQIAAGGGPSGQAPGHDISFTLSSDEPRFSLSCIAGLAPVRHVAVPVSRLREGVVLAEELDGGSLSARLSAGTYVTESAIERLMRALGPNQLVRIEERLDPLLHAG